MVTEGFSPPFNCILYIFSLHFDGDEKSFTTIYVLINVQTNVDHKLFGIHSPIFPLILFCIGALEFWYKLAPHRFSPINGQKLVKCEHIHLLSLNPENDVENFGVFSYLKCFSFAYYDIFRLTYLKHIQEKTVI